MPSLSTPPSFEPGRPRHDQIACWLRALIEAAELSDGERLPSERELEELCSVSRITVRHALRTLEAEGLIYRQQGLGSFVSSRQISQGLVQLTDFAEDMRRAGLEPSSRVLGRTREPASPQVAAALGLAPDTIVERLDRLRFGDGEPVALDRTWLPMFYAELLDGKDLESETIYEVLERDFSISIVSGRYRIEGAVALGDDADHLEVPAGSPLLDVHRTSLTGGERPIYHQVRRYRADRVAFELQASRVPQNRGAEMLLDALEPVFDFGRSGPTAQAGGRSS